MTTSTERDPVVLRKRLGEELDRRDTARREHLLSVAHDIAALLREHYGSLTITLIGSVATGRTHDHTDIDLFIEELPDKDLCHATGLALSSGISVDILTREKAPVWIETAIEKGIPL